MHKVLLRKNVVCFKTSMDENCDSFYNQDFSKVKYSSSTIEETKHTGWETHFLMQVGLDNQR